MSLPTLFGPARARAGERREVRVDVGKVELPATLSIPEDPQGLVLYACGGDSRRASRRNGSIAEVLQDHGIATLLLDLLTEDEEAMDHRSFQICSSVPLLAKRLAGATSWALRQRELWGLEIGYFGVGAGAAAAFPASTRLPRGIAAIVALGARRGLEDESLDSVDAPALLIVGGYDGLALVLNRHALAKLGCREKRLAVIRGATPLFEEPGTLENAAQAGADWFSAHFSRNSSHRIRRAVVS
ncbi:MAG: hypothetical protein ACRD4Y_18135 [Candidatus Acidiferrales bacterium]